MPCVDRKLFKMRELRGAGVVKVNHMPGEANPADLFTKILGRQVFEKHRKVILNQPAGSGLDAARASGRGAGMRACACRMSAWRWGGSAAALGDGA